MQMLGKQRRIVRQLVTRRCLYRQQRFRLRIVQTYLSRRVDNEHAILHVLNDLAVDANLIRQFDAALTRQILVGDNPPCQQARDDGSCKETNAGKPGSEEVIGLGIEAERPDCLLNQHGQRRQRRVEEGQAALANQPGSGHHHDQHERDTAPGSPARVHQHREESHIAGHLN